MKQNLYELLPSKEVDLLHDYLRYYAGGHKVLGRDLMNYYLREWAANKTDFYHAFGEKFIVKKEISLNKSDEELNDEMYHTFYNSNAAIRDLIATYRAKCLEIYKYLEEKEVIGYSYYTNLKSFVDDYTSLVLNVYEGPSLTIPGEITVNRKPLFINSGCKTIKMLGKIVKALGIDEDIKICPECGRSYDIHTEKCYVCDNTESKIMTAYESLRQAHSQVLNQKRIKGNLCLSIHPMDFLTMSDNDCGWTSCMGWTEDPGDYRLGTVEMMNSNCVIIAYVEASEDMELCGTTWNNKRWRQLYIVNKDMIVGNKQYPYHSDELQGVAIKWIRELMMKEYGYGPYPEEAVLMKNQDCTVIGEHTYNFRLYTCNMYNDLYGQKLAYIATQNINPDELYELCFSGPAICAGCGDYIDYCDNASEVTCLGCSGGWICEYCGDRHREYEEYWIVDGKVCCEYCYENDMFKCGVCGDIHNSDHMTSIHINIRNTDNEYLKQHFNNVYQIDICELCLEDDDTKEIFGELYEDSGEKEFDITQITDEGLESLFYSWHTTKFLKTVRDASCDEERAELIKKYFS